MTNGKEYLHDEVYGASFALYDSQDVSEFTEFFDKRFLANGISPEVFAGKRCLDAGCGNGRGALFMLSNGAAFVDCVDISPKNTESTGKNLKTFGFDNFTVHLSSLEKIPFDDNFFDIVWCNGVIMHTHSPDKCLVELSRVLKRNGYLWAYVYGSGGLYWYCVSRLRSIVREVPPSLCISGLKLIGYTPRFVAEYLDDWKVPYLRTFTDSDFGRRMAELGFRRERPLAFGLSYDTNHRKSMYPSDALWLGEGDLRYWTQKVNSEDGCERIHPLLEGANVDDYKYPTELVERFSPLFDCLEEELLERDVTPLTSLAACARIHHSIRLLMTDKRQFPVDEIAEKITETVTLLRGTGS